MYTPSAERAVRERYSSAAQAREAALCCPVDYDARYLEVIPQAVLDRDYGCGDPSRHLHPGETVLDLGSGGGKICFIASQVVGAEGRVIGVDMNPEMLGLAREHQPEVAEALGYDNVSFLEGRIQDLTLDRARLAAWLADHPVTDAASLEAFEAHVAWLRENHPLVPDGSVDVVVSNCVLNLVSDSEKRQLFREIHRVLRRGGRAVISDIVSDVPVPAHLKADPELWSGCISGAFEERDFLRAFEDAGFYGIELLARDETPWQVVEGIEFHSYTVAAYKGKEGECWDHREAVVYRGPFSSVTDDDDHVYERGERVAVCRKTFELLGRAPYSEHFERISPREPVTEPLPFDCARPSRRTPEETKGEGYRETSEACGPGCC